MKPQEPTRPVQTAEESSLLRQALLAMQQMQARLEAAERRNAEPIAIVGLGCRFPGAVVDGESFWDLLRNGRNAISEIPADRWNADKYFDPDPDKPGKMVSRWGGFLESAREFDAAFFGISPREAAAMDPQQRLALEVAWETLENAGIAPSGLQGTKTGVFLGIASGDYSQLVMESGDAELLDVHYASGVAHSIASGRISYLLGLEGPSVSLDTACSSSLVAVHLACQSLRLGDCNLALAGGVNLMLAPQTTALLSRVRMLSPDGCCKAFDDSADGFVRGEGCGFVALKRLSQALADGNRSVAVIRGTAANQDGASSSLTAPNGPSQIALMRQALANAGISSEQISFVEAHGTGTALGDPIELQSLGAVYGVAREPGDPLQVGSLKTNVGHLEAAAGVAGLIKAVLALQHRAIPPNLNFTKPTSHVDWKKLRLSVPTRLTDWQSPNDERNGNRFAAVSSFGFSGTNAHVVLEEAQPAIDVADGAAFPVSVFAVSAKSATGLRRSVEQYSKYLESHPETNLCDFCFTANTGRSHFSYRACFLASDVDQLQKQLAAFDFAANSTSVPSEARPCYLYTGQGSQYAGMGRELYESSAVFREAMERCARAFSAETGGDLIATLYPAEKSAHIADGMETASVAQAALYALEIALGELWRSWEVEPAVLLGHSLGEYAAAVAAGIFTVEEGMRLVCARARLMESLTTKGGMRSVTADVERVRQAIAGYEREISIAAVNGPESVVISGAAERVAEIAKELEREGIKTRALAVTHAFHSPLLEPVLEEFERIAETVKYREPEVRIISNRTGKAAAAGEMSQARYWREQMRGTIEFDAGLRTALATGPSAILEIGPQPHLIALGKSGHPEQQVVWLPSMRRGRNPWTDILATVQALYLQGAEIDWKALHGRTGRVLALPTYPFERTRHWFHAKPRTATFPARVAPQHPLLGDHVRSPLKTIQFESRIAPGHPAFLGDHIVDGHRVVPAAAYLEMALSAAAEVGGRTDAALREIAFLRPCVFDSACVLQCVLEEKSGTKTFAIYSRLEDDESGEWSLHATGEIVADEARSADAITTRFNFADLRKHCTEEISASAFYRMFEESNVEFGPAFRSIARICRGDTEVLAEFAIPAEARDKSAPYRVHPVALDACFQAVVALLVSPSTENRTIYLPAALESLRIVGDPRELACAHAKIRHAGSSSSQLVADVRGMDSSGRVLVEANGLVLRPTRQELRDAGAGRLIDQSFLEIDWVPVENGSQRESNVGANCVIAGDEAMTNELFSALAKRGACSAILSAKPDAANTESGFDGQIQSIAAKSSGPLSDCFYFAPRQADDYKLLTPEQLMKLEQMVLGDCVRLAQALLRLDQKQPPKLWIVTTGAQGTSAANVSQSTLWGFGRALAAEHPEMSVARVDFDSSSLANAEKLLQCILANPLEDELAMRGNDAYAPRLRRATLKTAGPSLPNIDTPSNPRLELVRPGTLEGLEIVESRRRDPAPDEVEIRIEAAGLNFRDVLNVLGMYRGNAGPLGGECAGTVVRVGAAVTSLRPGDEVVALGQGCFADYVTTRANMVWRKPPTLSFEAAVTIPVAFLTAWHALHSLASIQRGESVLIHAGAGGVGLAAIQIAQKAGAVVYATAGSPEKRAYLQSIGVRHVMDSRSLDFLAEVKQSTNGHGVDIVLNSLAGKFVDAGIAALAPGGRFLEMGVADIRAAESVTKLRPDISYLPFNLAPALEAGDSSVCRTLTTLFESFQNGELQPLPRKVFTLKDGAEAFRYMAQAKHIGRVVICPRIQEIAAGIRNDGAYLVTGGMSGIGRAVVEWLSQCGAAHVIAMGRSTADAATAEYFHKLQDAGTIVSIHQGDVACEADVQAAFDLASGLSLRGIFHCAGVLDDGVLLQQNWSRFERVLSPKVQGSWNLHRLSADRPLDHFVMFSSIASIFGSPGQTNYAAANAFLDGLAHYRRQLGLPAVSVNWCAWSETGVALRHGTIESGSKIGLKGMSTHDGLAVLSALMRVAPPQIAVAPMDWPRFFAAAGPQTARPFFADLRHGESTRKESSPPAPEVTRASASPTWLPQLRAAAPSRRQDALLQLLEGRVQSTLGVAGADAINPDQPLQELGLDSLLSIELRNALSASLDRSLPATLLFNYPTLAALARYLSGELFAEDVASARQNGSVSAMRAKPSDLLDEIEALSDGEVEQLLSTKAAGRAK
jgi:acyl transferase domain-containing protein/NADPH:quinone reductase-like Zn-dependent oxidoreductase/acyl carrier protein